MEKSWYLFPLTLCAALFLLAGVSRLTNRVLSTSASNTSDVTSNPVLLFHGLMDNYKTMEYMARKIERDFPGTYTHSIRVIYRFTNLVGIGTWHVTHTV